MKISHALVALVGVSLVGLATVGAGTGATFTDQTKTAQTITAGTLNVVVEANGLSGKSITLPAIQHVASVFDAPAIPVTIHNIGDLTANPVYLGLDVANSGNANDNALRDGVNVCITSPNPSPSIIFNGPLTTLAAMNGGLGQQIAGPLAPNATDAYSAEFYAGMKTVACGLDTYGGTLPGVPASLTDAAQGGTVTPVIKVSYEG